MEDDRAGTLSRYAQAKTRVRAILDHPEKDDRAAMVVQIILAATIVINTISVVIFTVPTVSLLYENVLNTIITVCLGIFAVEYVLRIWSCTLTNDPKQKVLDRIRYALHFYLIIDLISIIPFVFPYLVPGHVALLRLVRLVSIFKLGRYTRYSTSLSLFRKVLLKKREIFAIMGYFLIFILLFSSTVMYLVEYPAQPDTFSSIPAAMWWSITSVTTVGYGDIIPVTPLGRILAGLFILSGILVLALPSAILASGFMEEREKERLLEQGHELISPGSKKALLERMESLYREKRITESEYQEFRSILDIHEDDTSGG